MESNVMFFGNGDVCKEFAVDKHYIGLERNRLALSFCVDINYHEGYMVLVRVRDEELPKPI